MCSIGDAVARRDIDDLVTATMAQKMADLALELRALCSMPSAVARATLLKTMHPCSLRRVSRHGALLEAVAQNVVACTRMAPSAVGAGDGHQLARRLVHAMFTGNMALFHPVSGRVR